MRAGGCTVQQALTPEATSIVKQAVSLARRRGHAQVTPLHVANTMLMSSTGLLRTACLKSHSHPLQCKALELCFNVALNRLPASTSSPMLGTHAHHPSLSNALVAAFKRAQAHQRRGSVENQQQPLLAVKVEIEQLIISILDDPSVSRVMREAGFSSTQVKSNVEHAVSLDISSTNPSPVSKHPKEGSLLVLATTPSPSPSPSPFGEPVVGKICRPSDQVGREDLTRVIESLINRRNTVIVGDCLAHTQGVVRGVMDMVDKGQVPEVLRNVQFISLPLFSFGNITKEEAEQKLGEIRRIVKSCVGGGAILYLGDLKWATEYRISSSEKGRNYYCPVDHMIIELGRLVYGAGESTGLLRIMGISNFQTYKRCKIGHPSLETVWGLHPLTVPVDSLGLSLNPDREISSKRGGEGCSWSMDVEGGEKQMTCCTDYSFKCECEGGSPANNIITAPHHSNIIITSTLPSWLQQYKEENKTVAHNNEECFQVRDLSNKWNSICSSIHHQQQQPSDKNQNFCCISSPSASTSSYEQQHYPNRFTVSGLEPKFRIYIQEQECPQPVPNSNPKTNSDSSSDTIEMEYLHRFKEVSAENLKTLCNALEQKVWWQKDIIPEIASTLLQCRSGMTRRKGKSKLDQTPKEDTWLFFQGGDAEGKEKMARELAALVFGSQANFVSIGLNSYSSTHADHDCRSKRTREESTISYIERFADALTNTPHCVFFLEDIEQVEYYSQMGIKNAIERGKIRNSNGEEISLGDAIVVLSCESYDSTSRASSPLRQKSDTEEEEEDSVSLDLNLSIEDVDDPIAIDDIGLLESVDRKLHFKIQEEL